MEDTRGPERLASDKTQRVTVSVLFLLALFFYPVIAMVGSYPPITAPALVLVGVMMARNVTRMEWSDLTEAIPGFLVMVGIPFFYSIADGIALGLVTYPVVKSLGGKGQDVSAGMWLLAALLVVYYVAVRTTV